MGRKIPGKKHRGVKDPLEQRAKRDESLKNKVNAPPSDPNDQEIPKKVKEIMKFQEMLKTGQLKKKPKRPRNKLLDSLRFMGCGPKLSGQDDKAMPRVCQRVGESENSFLSRIDSVTADIISEANIEGQHNVKVKRNAEGGVEKIEMGLKEQFQSPKSTRKRKKDSVEIKCNRPSKKQRKKKKLASEEEPLLERKLDNVKFGEVVHAPPHLKARPRGSNLVNTAKPQCKSLLLSHFLNKSKIEACPSTKMKEEQRRMDVVQAYRQLKANKANFGKPSLLV